MAHTKKTTSSKKSKKAAPKSVKETIQGTAKEFSLSLPQPLGRGIRKYASKVAVFFRSVPSWIKGLPQAIRNWRAADKKKKKYRSFRLQKKIKPEPRPIPSALSLLSSTMRFTWQHKRPLIVITLLYSVVYFLLIRSPISTNIESIQEAIDLALGSDSQQSFRSNLATLGVVLGSGGSQQNQAAAMVGVLIFSLAVVWVVRQIHNNQPFKARDAYYQGTTSIFPVLLVLVVLSLQLIPLAVASFIYTTARSADIFVSGVEDMAFFVAAALIGLLSLYWVTSTIIALYAASLPGMYPLHALRAAGKLVKFQRFLVFRRIMALPVILGLLYMAILLLVIRFIPGRAFLATDIMQILIIPLVNIYLYKLYRKLI